MSCHVSHAERHDLGQVRLRNTGPSSQHSISPQSPRFDTSASPQKHGNTKYVCAIVITPKATMSSPFAPIAKLIPRISRRRARCDGQRDGSSSRTGGRRWMSNHPKAPLKRPKTAIFFPGKPIHSSSLQNHMTRIANNPRPGRPASRHVHAVARSLPTHRQAHSRGD
jgi:hypothetical protein